MTESESGSKPLLALGNRTAVLLSLSGGLVAVLLSVSEQDCSVAACWGTGSQVLLLVREQDCSVAAS